ncbi:MAG TPA: hypothetical protein DCO79_08920 [Spirochaeta sp.]|nr:hypothetical protein [Spirochaeta sp.]
MISDFNSYTAELRENIKKRGDMTIVMGNEAADLDSMASAVSYAWFLRLNEPGINAVPLINIPRADFKLRTEAVFLFNEAKVDIDSLIFTDDLDLEQIQTEGRLNLILIDHNKLAAEQSNLFDSVSEILDHHADEKNYPVSIKKDIRSVGSAATLVAERFLASSPDAVDLQLGSLLLGTILLDTVNLDPAAERVTDADSAAAAELITRTGRNQNELFNKLQFEKFNVSSLESYDLLRKDYKEWIMNTTKCGIASVLLSVDEWLKKDHALPEAFGRYLKERKLDVLLAMSAYTNPDFNRNLVVYVPDDANQKIVINFLEEADLGLELIETEYPASDKLVFYSQGNLGISRKKLQPLLNQLFTG